jgi:hypothetical protein
LGRPRNKQSRELIFIDCATHDTDDPSLFRNMLASPREIARIEPESAVLGVAAPDAYRVYPLRAKLGVGGLTAKLELTLLAVVRALGSCRGALMAGCTGDT